MLLPVVINANAGTLKTNSVDYLNRIDNYIKQHYPDIIFKYIYFNVRDSHTIVRQLKDIKFKRLIIAGGDGTINSVINELWNFDVEYSVLPLGTMNHFAKDNKIPLELEKAIDLAIKGEYEYVDLGEVNGRIFVNNSSIGLYPKNVIRRKALKYSRSLTLFFSIIAVFRKFPLYKLIIKLNDNIKRIKSPFIFIGNNNYDINLFSLGTRKSINDGLLCVYFSKSASRFSLFKFAFNILFHRLKQDKDFEIHYLKSLTIRSARRVMDIAADGEVFHLIPPLEYRILPKKLKLIKKLRIND